MTENTEPAKKGVTRIAYILDSSGSMGGLTSTLPGLFNQYIEEQKRVKGKVRLSLTVFDIRFETPLTNVKLKDVPEMVGYNAGVKSIAAVTGGWAGRPWGIHPPVVYNTPHPLTLEGLMPLHEGKLVYRPAGGTALYDAIGTTIASLEKVAKPEDKVLVVIHTDGYENSSKTFSHAQITAKITELDTDDSNWTFVFLGGGLDAAAAGVNLGLRASSTYSHSHDASGYGVAMQSLSHNTSALRGGQGSKLKSFVDVNIGRAQVEDPAEDTDGKV